MSDVLTREQAERKSSYILDGDGRNFAFLKYADRIETWELCDDELYRRIDVDDGADLQDVIRKRLIG